MSTVITWQDISIRLACTFIAGALIGLNRGEQGRPAGLRTTLLVCFAASVSMIQVNLLLPMAGKTPESFAVMDLMRLPLGILSGMGFIGGGAILKKGNLTIGVTTAATLWFVTVIGLCIGGGQIVLGLVSVAFALFILESVKWFEKKLDHKHVGLLTLTVKNAGQNQDDLTLKMNSSNVRAVLAGKTRNKNEDTVEYSWEVSWVSKETAPRTPEFVNRLEMEPGIEVLKWIPQIPAEN